MTLKAGLTERRGSAVPEEGKKLLKVQHRRLPQQLVVEEVEARDIGEGKHIGPAPLRKLVPYELVEA